jgi:integrase
MPRSREEWVKKDRCIWYCVERKVYRVDVNRQGKRFRRSYSSLAAARRARDKEEASIRDTDDLSTETHLRDMTVGQVVERFLREQILKREPGWVVEAAAAMRVGERARREGRRSTDDDLPRYITEKRILEKFLATQKSTICKLKVLQFKGRDALRYAEERLGEPFYGPNGTWEEPRARPPVKRTVAREITALRMAFEYLRLDYPNLHNPWSTSLLKTIDAPNQSRVVRSLEDGELAKLINGCGHSLGLNRYYMPVAIYMAYELGMRRQEILNLRWEDINDSSENRIVVVGGTNTTVQPQTIYIRKSKTDRKQEVPGRIIPLTKSVEDALDRLSDFVRSKDKQGRSIADNEKIFGRMTVNAFEKAWNWVRLNARLEKPFAFQDLRVTAINRFDKILTPTQIRIVVGHKGKNVTEGYIDRGVTHEDRMEVKQILDMHSKGWERIDELFSAGQDGEYLKLSPLDVVRLLAKVDKLTERSEIHQPTEPEAPPAKSKSKVIYV